LQNDGAGTKVAGAIWADGLFTDIARTVLKDLRAAFRAFAEWFLAGEIHFGLPIAISLAEIEFRFQFVGEANQPGEGLAHLAAETLQGTNHPLGNQLLNFGRLELPASGDLPEREVAALALKFFVVL